MPHASRDDPSPVYRLARGIGRALLGIYFRKLEIQGEEHLSAPGPAVFAANHPQSITDALVLGLGTHRMVHFVAHSGLFRNPMRAAFLRWAGVVPVFRPQDAEGAAEKNLSMFAACREVLTRGGVIGIFPEGTSRDERRLERLKTGTARIAFESEEAHHFTLGVRVVPVGIHFETPRRFRSRVLLRAGTPLNPRDHAEAYRCDPRDTVEAFTRELHLALSGQVVHVERAEWRPLIDEIEAVYRDELLARPDLAIPEGTPFLREAVLAGRIAKAVAHFQARTPGSLDRLAGELDDYRRLREDAGIPDSLLRPGSIPSARRTALRSALPLAAGFPVAVWGALWCGLPYHATRALVARKNPDPSKLHWTRLWVGLLVYAVYYPSLVYCMLQVLSGWGVVIFLAVLVPSGFFAMAYGRYWTRKRQAIRAGFLATVRKELILDLRAHRRRVIAEMDRLLEEYLRVREIQSS